MKKKNTFITTKEYSITIEGKSSADITNRLIPDTGEETVDMRVTKRWDDRDNLDGTRPGSVKVSLLADGEVIKTVTLSDENSWTAVITDLPRTDEKDGHVIVYAWQEDPVEGYTVTTADTANGTVITNTHVPELTSVSVMKVWDDDDNRTLHRPQKITVRLLADGVPIRRVELNGKNGWMYTEQNLPKSYAGKPIVYSWSEPEVMGYTLKEVRVNGTMTVFTNELWTRPDKPKRGAPPKVPGDDVEIFEDYDTPLALEILINHVGDCFD